jgi:hypothetical protein
VLILGNPVKTAKHSRGSGVIEDRADIFFEVRDATQLRQGHTARGRESNTRMGITADTRLTVAKAYYDELDQVLRFR